MIYKNELYHHGIKGQKWGIRRYQNEDGTLTEAGKERYYKIYEKYIKKDNNNALKIQSEFIKEGLKNRVIDPRDVKKVSDLWNKMFDLDDKRTKIEDSKNYVKKIHNLTDKQLDYEGLLDNLKTESKKNGYEYNDTKIYDRSFTSNKYLEFEDDKNYMSELKKNVQSGNQKAINYFNAIKEVENTKEYKEIKNLEKQSAENDLELKNINKKIVSNLMGYKGQNNIKSLYIDNDTIKLADLLLNKNNKGGT